MLFDFSRPWLLLLIPACLGCVWLIDVYFSKGITWFSLTRRRAQDSSLVKRVQRTTPRLRIARVLRAMLVILVGLAIAGPSIVAASQNSAAWLLLDMSDSTRSVRDDVESVAREALSSAKDELNTGIIAFGNNVAVETPLSSSHEYASSAPVDASGSRLSDALALAGALLPSDASGRVAVISDGATDDISDVAAQFAARGISVYTYCVSGVLPDAQVTKLSLPVTLYKGQRFNIDATIDSNMDTTGTLVLYANRKPVMTREVSLLAGSNSFTFSQTADTSGVIAYEAQLIADGDQRSENNSAYTYITVIGEPNVLVVEGNSGDASELVKMLTASNVNYELINCTRLPETADAYQEYESIVLTNIDADNISETQFSALESAVRYLGRGLCVLGGDSSFALGGYRGSELEKLLPVTIDVKSTLDLPSLALLLVIDKSGSMTDGQFGVTRLELAKEAAMRSTEVLTENDFIGVITFDDAAKWVVDLQRVEDVDAITAAIGTIRPGGGTAFYTALNEAYVALHNSDAAQKHVIFLTDGQPGDNGFDSIVNQMSADDITLTTVAIGTGADTKLLSHLAGIGGGRTYAAGEFDNVPKIFTKETYMVSGKFVQNRAFTPAIAEDSALTDFTGFPQLTGYLATTIKPSALSALVSDRDDPILAHWRYGAGEVTCWTSDIKGGWSKSFLQWEDASAFFTGMIAYTFGNSDAGGELSAEAIDDDLNVTYSSGDAAETSAALTTELKAISPSGIETTLVMQQSAPGMYAAELPVLENGAYALYVTQYEDGKEVSTRSGGAVIPYSKEYDVRAGSGESTLARLADVTGGRLVNSGAELFAGEYTAVRRRTDITGGLLLAAYILLLFNIALMKLPWERKLSEITNKRAERNAQAKQTRSATPDNPGRNVIAKQKPNRTPSTAEANPEAKSAPSTTDFLLASKRNKKLM